MVAQALLTPKNMLIFAIVVGIALILLVLGRPDPIPAGGCYADCTTKDLVLPGDLFDPTNIDSSMCGSGCLIDKIWYEQGEIQGYLWKVRCECCVCKSTAEARLGICNYKFGLFNYFGNMLKLCTLKP